MSEEQNELQQLKARLGIYEEREREQRARNADELFIRRIPISTKKAFIELANESFTGDYGMCLKWLLDDLIRPETRELLERLVDHEERIIALENKPMPQVPEVQEDGIHLGNGKILKRK